MKCIRYSVCGGEYKGISVVGDALSEAGAAITWYGRDSLLHGDRADMEHQTHDQELGGMLFQAEECRFSCNYSKNSLH